jgi:hypothetical protein
MRGFYAMEGAAEYKCLIGESCRWGLPPKDIGDLCEPREAWREYLDSKRHRQDEVYENILCSSSRRP